MSGWALLAVAWLGIAAHLRPPRSPREMAVSAFAPFLMSAAAPSLALVLVARSWTAVALAGIAAVTAATTQRPLFVASRTPRGEATLRVMTVNLKRGQASAESLVGVVAEERVDVLAAQELTPELVAALDAAGLEQLMPFRVLDARPGAAGAGLYSRHPLRPSSGGHQLSWAFVTARMNALGRDVELASVHLHGPYPNSVMWHADMRRLVSTLPLLGTGAAAADVVVVAGDFNASRDFRQYRSLMKGGFADCAEQAGAGFLPTFPANWRRLIPLLSLDHVVTRGAVGVQAWRHRIDGTDHRALMVDLAEPQPP